MVTIPKINQLSHRIFNTTVTEKTVARHSNPFAASNFQKTVLTADVVQTTNKAVHGTENTITRYTKRIYSTFVGSITDFGRRIEGGIETIKEFGSRMKSGIVNAWNTLNEIGNREVVINFEGIREFLNKDVTKIFGDSHQREITKLAKLNPVTEVKPMFTQALEALSAEMAI